jgi:hypothetical protein
VGGKEPYAWSLTSGTLPAGLTLSAGGLVAGTPTRTGAKTVTLTVTDAAGAAISVTSTITVYSPPVVSTSNLSNGTLNVAYSKTLAATGGKSPYAWSIASGSLPPGLTLNPANGSIAGTPTSKGTFAFTARVTDTNGKSATKALSIKII